MNSNIELQNTFTDEKENINQKEGERIASTFSLSNSRLHLKSWQKGESTNVQASEDNKCLNYSKGERTFYMNRNELYRLNNLHLNRLHCKALSQIKNCHPDKTLTLLDFSCLFSPISLQMGCHGYPSGTVVMKSESHELYQTLSNTNDLSEMNYDLLDVNEWRGLTQKYDVILCDPVEMCGALRQQIFEDLDILK